MERNLLLRDKKGVSLMIGYVLLIAMAVALSVGVFFYLKLHLPSQEPKCYEDVDLTIDELRCVRSTGSNYDVYINISNRGLFSVDSAYIKIGDVDRVFKNTLKDPQILTFWLEGSNKCIFGNELKPGQKFCGKYSYSPTPSTVQEITVEPLLYIDKQPVLCPGNIIKKTVVCT